MRADLAAPDGPLPVLRPRHSRPLAPDSGVRSSALFGVLDDEGLDHIHTRIASLEVAPDQPVYERGGAGTAVYTVRGGIVRFERFTERGDRRIVRLAGRGDEGPLACGNGLSDLDEWKHGTDPHERDSDRDGIEDGPEVADGTVRVEQEGRLRRDDDGVEGAAASGDAELDHGEALDADRLVEHDVRRVVHQRAGER